MKKPFTLVEILIAMSVLAVFLLGLMQFYSSTETLLSSGAERTEMYERARIAMDMMANDLGCIYYSQTDKNLHAYLPASKSNYFEAATVRPDKLKATKNDKEEMPVTCIIGVKYELDSSKYKLYYSRDISGDTFDVSKASWGTKNELVDGVTKFEVLPVYGEGFDSLPALVVIRMELVDKKTATRLLMNPSAKSAILEHANRREFRRMVVIDRGQPKPKLNL